MMPFTGENPFEELEDLFERMSREFEGNVWDRWRTVAVDVAEEDDAFVVTADLPGFERTPLTSRSMRRHSESMPSGTKTRPRQTDRTSDGNAATNRPVGLSVFPSPSTKTGSKRPMPQASSK
jgi:hypothetical protein